MVTNDKQHDSGTVSSRLITLITNMSDEEQKKLLRRLEQGELGDKRAHPRRPYTVSVDLVTAQGTSSGTIKNISVGGVLLQPGDLSEFYFGQEIVVHIPFPGHEKIVKMPGEVVRIDATGVGVKFLKKPS